MSRRCWERFFMFAGLVRICGHSNSSKIAVAAVVASVVIFRNFYHGFVEMDSFCGRLSPTDLGSAGVITLLVGQ